MSLVVIGGMAAGLSAASRARRVDPRLEILVLEKGDMVSVGSCGLPFYVEGRLGSPEDLVVLRAETLLRERNIQVRTGATVAAIQHPSRHVQLAGGERIPYGKLILAAGARPKPAALPFDSPRVFSLYSVAEARRLREFLDSARPRRAAVVGAGYIGLEAAGALKARGLEVTIWEREEHVLGRQDSALTADVREHLHASGVEVKLGSQSREAPARPFDLVVSAAGLAPDASLAAEAGARIGPTGAIATDEHMETSLNGVYAAGDCAEARCRITGRPVWIPLGTTANRMGRIAGACAAGARESFLGVVGTSVVQVLGLSIGLTGLSLEEAGKQGFDAVSARIQAPDRARYFAAQPATVELVADRRTRILLGGSVLGVDGVAGRINVIAAALTAKITVDEFEQMDLAYTPPLAPVTDPVLVAARRLLRLLD